MKYNFVCPNGCQTKVIEWPMNKPFDKFLCSKCKAELKQDFSQHNGFIKIPFHMRATTIDTGLNYKKSKKKRVY